MNGRGERGNFAYFGLGEGLFFTLPFRLAAGPKGAGLNPGGVSDSNSPS
jgi:hypothetical protein